MNTALTPERGRSLRLPWAAMALGLLGLTTLAQGQTRVALNVLTRVTGACELRSVALPVLTLRCTRGFTPADPRDVLGPGVLPDVPLVWVGAAPAPDGGTLHEYRVAPELRPPGAARPDGWIVYY